MEEKTPHFISFKMSCQKKTPFFEGVFVYKVISISNGIVRVDSGSLRKMLENAAESQRPVHALLAALLFIDVTCALSRVLLVDVIDYILELIYFFHWKFLKEWRLINFDFKRDY